MQMYKPFYTPNILFVIKLKYFLLYIYNLWFTISGVKTGLFSARFQA